MSTADAPQHHQLTELEASIRELEAHARTADADGRKLLEQQIANLRDAMDLLRRNLPAMEASKQHRLVLTPELAAFFTPQPAVVVPAWFPDTTKRADVRVEAMRCPAGAKVYEETGHVSCALPGQPGVALSRAHGLSLTFNSEGRLSSQDFFENDLMRWSISYHLTGARDRVGFYVSTEPKTYIQHGLHTRYAANGIVVSQSDWLNGRQHGWHKNWEDDGFPVGATRFSDGREVERVLPNGQRQTS
jgi:hypothetical protein